MQSYLNKEYGCSQIIILSTLHFKKEWLIWSYFWKNE